MNKMTTSIILIITITSTGLIAGLFYAYSCSVNVGLAKLTDKGYIDSMQSINRAIQNPMFFATFIGTLLLLPLSTWLQYKDGVTNTFLLFLTATVIYIIGVFGVTVFGNVPLNEMLDKFNLQSASLEEISSQRIKFEVPWNKLHGVRALAAAASLVLVIIACVNRDWHKLQS